MKQDKNKVYWWGRVRCIYRGHGASTGYPRKIRLSKPIFHAWSSVSQKLFCLFLAYGWWSYQAYVKMPAWAARAIRWYQLYRLAKRKAP